MKHYIIPVFIPHWGCVHQCVFCNQRKITGCHTTVTADQVSRLIDERLTAITQKRRIEVAFYGGSFTALPLPVQNELLAPASRALRNGRIQAIRISTRPDCITPAGVANLRRQGVSTVELGVQSLDNQVLAVAKRGHQAQAVAEAVQILQAAGVVCGLQLMPGLPGEDWVSLLQTVRQVLVLKPDFVRIYPVVVIADTALAQWYKQGCYQPLSLDKAVARSAYMKLVFERRGIAVIRTGLQASEELDDRSNVLAGPYHPAFGELVDSYLFYVMLAGYLEQQGQAVIDKIVVHHHPQEGSKVRGQCNANRNKLLQEYSLKAISFQPDSSVKQGSLIIKCCSQQVIVSKNMINCI